MPNFMLVSLNARFLLKIDLICLAIKPSPKFSFTTSASLNPAIMFWLKNMKTWYTPELLYIKVGCKGGMCF